MVKVDEEQLSVPSDEPMMRRGSSIDFKKGIPANKVVTLNAYDRGGLDGREDVLDNSLPGRSKNTLNV